MNKYTAIKKACQITDDIFEDIVKNSNYCTEVELSEKILGLIEKRGLKPSFPPIVAAGKNAANPHHEPTKSLLKEFVVVDFGVRYQGYCSDMTRMFYVGKISVKEKEMYDELLRVQKGAILKLKIGDKYSNVCEWSREQLGALNKFFIHSLGHGIGGRIHQEPKVSVKSKSTINMGDFVTIEPGIYIKEKMGIRIEDTVYVGKDIEILTKSSKKLVMIK